MGVINHGTEAAFGKLTLALAFGHTVCRGSKRPVMYLSYSLHSKIDHFYHS